MMLFYFFFFNYPATTEIFPYLHTLSLHDALPIFLRDLAVGGRGRLDHLVLLGLAGAALGDLGAVGVGGDRLGGARHHGTLGGGDQVLPLVAPQVVDLAAVVVAALV